MIFFVSRNRSSRASPLQPLSIHAFSRHALQLKLQETDWWKLSNLVV